MADKPFITKTEVIGGITISTVDITADPELLAEHERLFGKNGILK